MPALNYVSTIEVPVDVNGTITVMELACKDADARALIADLSTEIASWGQALKWIGVTTTALTDGDSTNPITINGQAVTATGGNMTAYNGTEYVWDADTNVWQAFGTGNLGTLAYRNSATGNYTPAGTVTVSEATAPTITTVNSITDVGELPYFTVSGDVATFHPGTLPTQGSATTVVTGVGTHTAAFTGTPATITVS